MNAIDRGTPEFAGTDSARARRKTEAAALWSALRADRSARDERTARLRAMRLALGEEFPV